MEAVVESAASNLSGIASRQDLADLLERFREDSGLTYERIAEKLAEDDTGRGMSSTPHDWLTVKRIPTKANEPRFRRCLTVIGVPEVLHEPVIELLGVLRREQRRRKPGNPYVGLKPYTEDDEGVFAGRSRAIDDALTRIASCIETDSSLPIIFVGASGCGKSSLLHAGLKTKLAQGGTTCSSVRLGANPKTQLIETLDQVVAERRLSRRVTGRDLLIIDQFEQLLLLASREEVTSVLATLKAAAKTGYVTPLIALRSDFYRQASEHEYLATGLDDRAILVRPLTANEAGQAIVEPAARRQRSVAPDLVARIVTEFRQMAEADGFANALPLLSLVLFETAELAGSSLTMTDYESTGGLRGALKKVADDVYESLDADSENACRHLFIQLVALSEEGVAVGRSASLDELGDLLGEDAQDLIDAFAGSRLITVGEEHAHVSHEALLSAWPRLERWINEAREDLVTARRISTATQDWLESDESADALLTGTQLAPALDLAARANTHGRLTGDEHRFITASREAQEEAERGRRRTTQRLITLTAGLAAATVVAGVLALMAQRSLGDAEEARAEALSRQLALQASILRETDSSLSHQVALVAYQTSPTSEALAAVLDAAALPGNPRYLGSAGPTAVAASSDGHYVAYSDAVNGTVQVMRKDEHRYVDSALIDLPGNDDAVYAMAVSPDSAILATAGSDLAVTLWDTGTGERHQLLDTPVEAFTDTIQSLVYSNDGERIYAGGEGAGVVTWQRDDDRRFAPAEIFPVEAEVMSMSLTDSGELLAVAARDGTISLWSTESAAAPLWSTRHIEDAVASTVALSPKAQWLVAGYRNSTIRLWSLEDPSAPVEIESPFTRFASWVTWLEFSPDGSLLAASSSDGSTRVWQAGSWSQLGPDLQHPNVATSLRFVDDSAMVVAVADGSIRSWDLSHVAFTSLDASVWSTTFNDSGTRLLAASGLTAGWWEYDGGSTGPFTPLPIPDSSSGLTGATAMSPDGKLAALGTRTGPVHVVPLANPVAYQDLNGPADLVENVTFSSDGALLAAAADDGLVQLWAVDNRGQWLPRATVPIEDQAMNVAFAPGDELIVALSDEGPAYLIDVSNLDAPVRLSQVQTGDSLALSVALHPTKPLLATGNADTSVIIWDYSDPSEPTAVAELSGPNGRVHALAFSPDGDALAAGVGDNTVWIWDLGPNSPPSGSMVLNAPHREVLSLAFSPEGTQVVAAGGGANLIIWHLDPAHAIESICASIGDSITVEEWADYVPTLDYRPPCPPA